jgi:predicted PurR-regulated permease PerM
MNKFFKIFVLSCVFITGCGSPFSPKLRQQIDNQNGKIDDISTNTNGIMLDILKLKNDQQIMQRDVENFQQGLINLENRNQNSGVQIFQGSGGLVVGFALTTIGMLLIYNYRSKAIQHQKTAELLAQQIVLHDSEDLQENVFKAAMYTNVESNVYHLITKQQKNLNAFRK